jgi:hypothetical protein
MEALCPAAHRQAQTLVELHPHYGGDDFHYYNPGTLEVLKPRSSSELTESTGALRPRCSESTFLLTARARQSVKIACITESKDQESNAICYTAGPTFASQLKALCQLSMHDCGLGPHGMYSESTRSPWMHLMNTKQSMSLHSYKQYSSSSQKILNGNLQLKQFTS